MNSLRHDVRLGLRSLRRSRGFTLIALLTLALGIGANTAIFSMIHGVLLAPLPYPDGDRLVHLVQQMPRADVENLPFSVKEVVDYREGNRTLAGVVEYHSMWFNLLGGEEPERVQTAVVSADFFDVLGLKPLMGRTFLPEDDDLGAEPVLVLTHSYWKQNLGGDPAVIGRHFEMNDKVHTVVGVLPPVPQFPEESDVYMPTSACPFRSAPAMIENRQGRMLTVFGRLKPGVTLVQAQADLSRIASALRQTYPESYPAEQGYGTTIRSVREELTSGARTILIVLLATAGLVLLIACANVANLAFARSLRRQRELAVRAALGAGRGALVRQLLTESTLLAIGGGVLGLLLAWFGLDLLVAFAERFTARAGEIEIDLPILLFTLGASVGAGLAFGAFPALASGRDLVGGLKEGSGPTTVGRRPLRIRGMLVVTQLALSFTLLAGAGLMLRTLLALSRVDPGFDPQNVLTMTLDLDWAKYRRETENGTQNDPVAMAGFYRPLIQRVSEIPGVLSAAVAATFPLDQSAPFNGGFRIEGRPVEPGDPGPQADFRIASPDYFRTLNVPILDGRVFTAGDDLESPFVVVLNQSMARAYWGDRSPIGARISTDNGETWDTVVGVVGDVRQYGLDTEPANEIYYSYLQNPINSSSLLVRTVRQPTSLAEAIRQVVYGLDPEQPVANVRTLEEVRDASLSPRRVTALLLALFAGVALVMAATGIAGVLAFSVSQRTREIGIRMALGADTGSVLRMVMRQGMSLVLVGLALGAVAAFALSRLMEGLLFGVQPTDAATFAAVTAVLTSAAALACFLPARRATGVSPLTALRAE